MNCVAYVVANMMAHDHVGSGHTPADAQMPLGFGGSTIGGLGEGVRQTWVRTHQKALIEGSPLAVKFFSLGLRHRHVFVCSVTTLCQLYRSSE